MEVREFRSLGDRLKEGGARVVILGSTKNGRVTMVAMVTPEAVKKGCERRDHSGKGRPGDGRGPAGEG